MQRRLTNWLTKNRKEVDNVVVLARLLAGGSTITTAAKVVGVSKQYVSKVAKKLVKEGILIRVGKRPVLFSWTKTGKESLVNQFSLGVREDNQGSDKKALFEPHRFGAKFLLRRKPKNVKGYTRKVDGMKNWTRYIWKEGDFTLELFPNLLMIWTSCHDGSSVDELIKNGLLRLRERALAFCEEQDLKVAEGELMHPVEWIIKEKGLSDYVCQVLDLKQGAKEIAEANFVVDFSHPENVEINEARNTKSKASEAIKLMEWYLTEAPAHFAEMAKNHHELSKNVEEIQQYLLSRKYKS